MIAFEAVSKRYGAQVALDGLTLSVGPGEIVALLGPNGAGKTTALKMAAGLIRPTSGRVLVRGEDPVRASARRNVSFLPQRVGFADSLTGAEIVEFYRRLRGGEEGSAASALRLVSLNGASARAVGTYSVGMQQRLALAVSVVSNAPILLLDEPAASLDPEGLQAFHDLALERKASGGSIFFSSHQLGDAERLADRFAILVSGKIVAMLEREDLVRRLASRGRLRLRVSGEEVVVRATAEERPAILEKIRREGGVIESISTDEGRLEDLYGDLVKGGEER